MFNKYCFFVFYFFLFQFTQAQCAMCRAVLESEEGSVKAAAVNDGIVYLMSFPYVLIAIIGFVIYKMKYKSKKTSSA